MTKQLVEVLLNNRASLNGSSLREAREQIQEWIEKYGADACFEIGIDYNQKIYHRLYGVHLETGEEYARRKESEKKREAAQEALEAAEYKRLQAKFNKGE